MIVAVKSGEVAAKHNNKHIHFRTYKTRFCNVRTLSPVVVVAAPVVDDAVIVDSDVVDIVDEDDEDVALIKILRLSQ